MHILDISVELHIYICENFLSIKDYANYSKTCKLLSRQPTEKYIASYGLKFCIDKNLVKLIDKYFPPDADDDIEHLFLMAVDSSKYDCALYYYQFSKIHKIDLFLDVNLTSYENADIDKDIIMSKIAKIEIEEHGNKVLAKEVKYFFKIILNSYCSWNIEKIYQILKNHVDISNPSLQTIPLGNYYYHGLHWLLRKRFNNTNFINKLRQGYYFKRIGYFYRAPNYLAINLLSNSIEKYIPNKLNSFVVSKIIILVPQSILVTLIIFSCLKILILK